jgi:glycolate oxidase iron-sulfur subunit
VQCGFCTATCPTYQLLGDELDGPRGRIYILKQLLEGQVVTQLTQQHMDRCLTCRGCETTCPSGVRYGRLLDITRPLVEQRVGRSMADRVKRWLMLQLFPYPQRFAVIIRFARMLRPLLSNKFKENIPQRQQKPSELISDHQRKMLIFPGCVQQILAPEIDSATAHVLDRLGISLIKIDTGSQTKSGCCGALNYHLADHETAKQFARNNIDACWPYIEQGAEKIVMTASGCGLMIKEYAELLQFDSVYAEKAAKVSAITADISEVIAAENLAQFSATEQKLVFQSPCTLQHGLNLSGRVESILSSIGWQLLPVADAHMCCGSAGVYSLLQPEISGQLRDKKLLALQANDPELIVTANIGCLTHLQSSTQIQVKHWIELLVATNEKGKDINNIAK